jgi:hypothetical protein
MKISAVLCFSALVAYDGAYAKQPDLIKHTASGKAEATIPGVTVDEFRNEIVLGCTKQGMDVEPELSTVICSKLKEGGRGFAAELLLGNRLSGKPYDKIKFTFAKDGDGVFVTAESYLEMTMGFGEVKKIPYTNNAVQNDIQAGLDRAAENARARQKGSVPNSHDETEREGGNTDMPGEQPEPASSSGMKYRPKGL